MKNLVLTFLHIVYSSQKNKYFKIGFYVQDTFFYIFVTVQ